LQTRDLTPEYGMETSPLALQAKVQNASNCRMHPTVERLMLTVFWDSQGLLLELCRERGSTVNSTVYSEVLCDKLKPAHWSK
jgi:hypothetical protein